MDKPSECACTLYRAAYEVWTWQRTAINEYDRKVVFKHAIRLFNRSVAQERKEMITVNKIWRKKLVAAK